jgi:hypothetical protein
MSNRWKEGLRALTISWGALTLDERKVLCLILALACLGLAARAWHRQQIGTQAQPPAAERAAAK